MAVIPLNLSSKVTFEAFEDEACKTAVKDGILPMKMKLQINPEEISHDHEIRPVADKYDALGVEGTRGGRSGVKGFEMEKITMTFYLDGTGLVPGTNPVTGLPQDLIIPFDVGKWIKNFKKMAYHWNADIHAPNCLKITWGSLFNNLNDKCFKCRLTNLDIEYLLFKPTGTPLRAKLQCTFTEVMAPEDTPKGRSPDMSHVKTVRAGDRLPLLCKEVYGSSSFYLKIAKINGLTNIYQLKPGQKLLFPPLEK